VIRENAGRNVEEADEWKREITASLWGNGHEMRM
jgi:hypothetical protein